MTIHRLRALKEVACTGLHGANRLASTSFLKALVYSKLYADALASEMRLREDNFSDGQGWMMSNGPVDKDLIQL